MSVCKIITYPDLFQPADEQEVSGKFVQFCWRGVVYILFATKAEHRFHNQMLAHFLKDHGLPHRWTNDENLSIDTDDLEVQGGGRFHYDRLERKLELWDNSQAYGRFTEEGLAECIHAAEHPWSDSSIIIS